LFTIGLTNKLISAACPAEGTQTSNNTNKDTAQEDYVHITEEDGSDVSFQSTIAEHLVDIRDNITELQKLVPSLNRSVWSVEGHKSDETKANWDLSHVNQKFPNANSELAKTLGIAGWNRRQHVMGIAKAPAMSKPLLHTSKSEVSYDDLNRPAIARSSVKQSTELDTIDQTKNQTEIPALSMEAQDQLKASKLFIPSIQ